jgi:tetratricopeptide (TPR) repeat protein
VLAAGAVKRDFSPGFWFQELEKDDDAFRRKAVRDIAILEEETAANPRDQRWWYYLGDAHATASNCAAAVQAWSTCVGITDGWDEEGAWCAYRAAQCLWKQDAEEAIAILQRGMARHARLPELPWYVAWILHKSGRQKAALKWARRAAALGCVEGPCEPRVGFRHPPASYEAPYDVMRFALRELGDNDAAKVMDARFEEAKLRRPKHS